MRQDPAGVALGIDLGEELTAGLKALAQRRGTTLFMTLLAGWAAVLGRLSGQHDVVVGTPSANRGRTEIEGLIGFFVNTLAVRVDLSESSTVAELLEQVRARALGAQQNQDIPFEQVVERVQPARSMAHSPLFQVMFSWQNASEGGLELPGLRLAGGGAGTPPVSQAVAKFDLSLALGEAGGRIVGSLTYATSLFERETVERWTGYLRRVLEAFAGDDLQAVDALPLMPEAERLLVVEEWNATGAAYPRELCIHEVFEAQARRTPGAVAVEYEDRALAYAELNARANRLAHHLRALGVGPDARVALCVERGVEMVVAMLAVLKAGGAYVPLDPSYPDERLRYMLADSRPVALLASRPRAARFAAAGVPVLDPANEAAWAHLPASDPRPAGLSPDHLCYVIYTSGSTGLPKGVTVPHRGVVSLLADVQRRAPIGEGDGCSVWTSTSFDVSVYEIFSALLAGGRLCIPPGEVRLDAFAFLDWMEAREVRSAYLPPYFLPELRERVSRSPGRTRLHRLLVGVEPIAEPLLAEIRRGVPGLRIINGYGPTETTICATLHDVPETARGERVTPIGAPAANTRVFVLDARMRPVPIGVVGELYVGGAGVARGYLDRPALTAERLVPDPLSGEPGARLYRTGDLGRWLPEGALAFAGRTDAQVKVRGYRVEPGEIEARLVEHPAVREAVVLAREDAPGDQRLVAYVVGDETGAEPLRAHLAERLPEHMVPAAYVRLGAMPLTPSGKVDRKALPAPEGDAFARRGYEAPVGATEQALAEVWSELLGVERVGRHDNFFELGGHSLLAVRMVSRVRQVLGAEVVLAHLFSHPTVESLAARVSGSEPGVQGDRAIAIRALGSQPPLFLVHEGAGSTAYAQLLHPHLDGDIPVYALPAAPADAPLRTVEGMAARLVRVIREVQPAGPYRLAGWSFGGVLAYEAAAQLIGRDEVVEFVGMIDSYHPARAGAGVHDVAQEHALLLHVLRMAEPADANGRVDPDEAGVAAGDADLETFVTRCREQGLLPGHVTVEQARGMRDRLRTHQRALREYSPQPLPVAVHLFPARQSPEADPTRGWGAFHPKGWLRVTPVPGTHLSMIRAPNAAVLGEALSRAIGGAGEEAPPAGAGSPLVTLQGGAGGAAPLFCVPGAGSGVTSFVDLLMALDPSVPVHGLQPRGLDAEAPPHATVQAAAEHYLRALREACPAGPVHLLGHSFGGWVALEMALRLHEAGRPAASLTILDSEVPDDSEAVVREYGGGEAFLKLVEVLELAAERSLGIGPADVASRDEAGWLKLLHGKMVGLGLLGARAAPDVLAGPFRTFARCLRTAYRPSGVYAGPLRLVLVDDPAKDGAANQAAFAEAERGWRTWAPGLVFSAGAGNHVTALKAPHVAVLAGFLAEDRAAREG